MKIYSKKKPQMNKICTKQDIYQSQDFLDNLDTSQSFVKVIGHYLYKYGLFARLEDDKDPFINYKNEQLRLCDIMAIDKIHKQILFIEAKDNCSLVKVKATGEPKEYIHERLNLLNNSENVFIIWRENHKYVEQLAQFKNTAPKYVINQLVNEKRAIVKPDGSLFFIPYGHSLKFLLQPENIRTDLAYIKSMKTKYYGQTQYLWNTSLMLPINELLENVCHLSPLSTSNDVNTKKEHKKFATELSF